MSLDSSDSESSSLETDDSDSESDGSSDTDADSDTEGEDFGAIEKKPARAKQKGRAMYIYMYTVFMLLKKAHRHNQFVWACITIQLFFNYTQRHFESNRLMPTYFSLIFLNFGRVLV